MKRKETGHRDPIFLGDSSWGGATLERHYPREEAVTVEGASPSGHLNLPKRNPKTQGNAINRGGGKRRLREEEGVLKGGMYDEVFTM